jgi:hypothetical protein
MGFNTLSLEEYARQKGVCIKGMTPNTCPYNPLLGCDCGINKPHAPITKDQPMGPVKLAKTRGNYRAEDYKDDF